MFGTYEFDGSVLDWLRFSDTFQRRGVLVCAGWELAPLATCETQVEPAYLKKRLSDWEGENDAREKEKAAFFIPATSNPQGW